MNSIRLIPCIVCGGRDHAAVQRAVCYTATSQSIRQTSPADPNGRDAHEPGAKLDAGKLQPDLILSGFAHALTAVAEVGTHGAEKYTRDGWSSVPDGLYRYRNAGQRHALARARGEEVDADSGLRHLAHEAWNKLAELELALRSSDQAVPGPGEIVEMRGDQ